MKEGDIVWVWSPWAYSNVGKIESGKLVYLDANWAEIRMANRLQPYRFLASEIFPTREALCEHYRKVFE